MKGKCSVCFSKVETTLDALGYDVCSYCLAVEPILGTVNTDARTIVRCLCALANVTDNRTNEIPDFVPAILGPIEPLEEKPKQRGRPRKEK